MNRFFSKEDWGWEMPKRVYARLDDLEPIAAGPDDDLTFIFDTVDVDWRGFGPDGPFDLAAPELRHRMATYWKRRFEGDSVDGPEGYDQVPLYRIELSLSRCHPSFGAFPQNAETWISLDLADGETDLPVTVYGGLFTPPRQGFLRAAVSPAPSLPLNAVFDMGLWPDATELELLEALKVECGLTALVCFDIGQGSASALVCDCGTPAYYFDTGRGSGRNAQTAPTPIDFCTCQNPVVIMSHWDTDHWAGATGHRGLLQQIWIVPRQTISSTHTTFANDILAAGGRIMVVPNGGAPLQWSTGTQDYDLRRGTGAGRNGTGQILVVTDIESGRSWVLTGDAGYNEISHPVPSDIAAMVAPHHGADMGVKSVPFPRSGHAYARLFYSFGPDNAHGPNKLSPVKHPVAAAIQAHTHAKWKQGAWTPSHPALVLAGADVLATATHNTTHLKGGAAGWTGPPTLTHLLSCPNAMPVPQA